MQRRDDAQCERALLRKVIQDREERRDEATPLVAAVIHARRRTLDRGAAATARRSGDRWLDLLGETDTLHPDERERAQAMLVLLMSDRFKGTPLRRLFPRRWRRVRETAMVRELLAEGERKGERKGKREGERKGKREGKRELVQDQLRLVLGKDRALERALRGADERAVTRIARLLVKGYPAEELRARVLRVLGVGAEE